MAGKSKGAGDKRTLSGGLSYFATQPAGAYALQIGLLTLLALVVAVAVLAVLSYRHERENVRNDVISTAVSAAQIAETGWEEVTGNTPAARKTFVASLADLQRYQTNVQALRLIRIEDGRERVLLDAASDPALAAERGLTPEPQGKILGVAPSGLADRIRAGEAIYTESPGVDSGIFLSGYAPVRNVGGEIVAFARADAASGVVNALRDRVMTAGLVAFLLGGLIAILAAVLVWGVRRENDRLNELLLEMANIDELTGLATRRYFLQAGEYEFSRARRYGRPLCILVYDIDHFKLVNDTYGHAAGDTALSFISSEAMQTIRTSDLLGRLGGEEFAILAPETTLANARILAARLRENIEAAVIDTPEGPIRMTVSIGVVEWRVSDRTLDHMVQRADHAMYAAKQAGRNRIATQDEVDEGGTGGSDGGDPESGGLESGAMSTVIRPTRLISGN